MIYILAILAACGAAISNGIAICLEKISADKKSKENKLRINFLISLLHDWPYVIGIVLDLTGWFLTLIAVHILPLFIVQPIIALSVIIAVVVDATLRHRKPKHNLYYPMVMVFGGLIMLGISASPEKAHAVNTLFKWIVILGPFLIAVLGQILTHIDNKLSTFSLAGISGVAFGFTAIAGRLLKWGHPYWKIIDQPLLWAIIVYGVLGLLILTVALQRHLASSINAIVVAFETIVPIVLGIFFLGDRPRLGLWPLVSIGLALAIAGTIAISLDENTTS